MGKKCLNLYVRSPGAKWRVEGKRDMTGQRDWNGGYCREAGGNEEKKEDREDKKKRNGEVKCTGNGIW